MKESILISIVMPCYKMGHFIGKALASVGKQTYSNWELIAVDDCGPNDGTREVIEAFQKSFPEKNIVYKRLKNNKGVSSARNIAVELSAGSVLAFLDPDDLWKKNHLAESIIHFYNNKHLDVVCSPVEVFNFDKIDASVLWPIESWQREYFPMSLAASCFIQPSAALIRKSAFLEVSGFCTDPELQHIEDWDFWIRLTKNAKIFYILDLSTCYYRLHDAQATKNTVRNIALHDVLVSRHPGFFMQMQGYLLARSLDRSNYVYDLTSGPFFRALSIINKCSKYFARILKTACRFTR